MDHKNAEKELEVWAAIVRYAATNRIAPTPIFLTIRHQDPPEELMARIADLKPAVKRVSQCDFRVQAEGSVFHIDSLEWISPDEVKAIGGTQGLGPCAGLCTYVGTFHLSKEKGHWKVLGYVVGGTVQPRRSEQR